MIVCMIYVCVQAFFFCLEKVHFDVGIEINLSCPNIINKGQLAYDFSAMDFYLSKLFTECLHDKIKIIGIKLPPYFELHHFKYKPFNLGLKSFND